MPTGKQIATRLSEAQIDTDLGLIYGIWPEESRSDDVMRSSDYLAIRKAASALDRTGRALARHLTQDGAAVFRTLPEIKPTIRVRKIPQRFWIEFELDDNHRNGATRAVLFIEFSKTEVRVGVRFPIITVIGVSSAKTLHHPISMDAEDAVNWQVEQRRPPAEPAACSNDLKIWLTGRIAAQQQKTVFQTLSKACPKTRPLMKDLIASLSEASTLFDTVKVQQETGSFQAIKELPHYPRKEAMAEPHL